jgi:hypothetical protein
MKNSYSELATRQNNIYTRKFGGTTIGVADPYVSGYFFIWFNSIPASLPSIVNASGNANVSSSGEIQSILAGSCTGVTPPGGTLNKIEFTGLGGVKWSVPGNIDYGTGVTLKFLEFNKTPILDIIHGWTKMIRDYRTGVSQLVDGEDGGGYSKSKYASTLFYWTVAPDGQTPEYYACYDGVFPTKDPQDLFASDVENVAKLDVEIEFNVDYIYHEQWVYNKCLSLTQEIFLPAKATVLGYGDRIVSG